MNHYRLKIVYAAIVLITLVVVYFLLTNSSLAGFFALAHVGSEVIDSEQTQLAAIVLITAP